MSDTTPLADADVIVLGLGAMGSAAAWHLARRGARVLGVDRWTPPHAAGSTHGRTRVIREAYYEAPAYVPLVRRAYELWTALERESGRTLFRRTGGIMLGASDGELVSGARRSAREHALPHEDLSAADVRRRLPILALPDDMVGLWEPRAGILFPELCVSTVLDLAQRHGAVLRLGERVVRWHVGGDAVVVTTDRAHLRARRLVLAAGPWLPSLAPDLSVPLAVERQVMHWFAPRARAELFRAEGCPVLMVEHAPGRMFYTIPDVGHGVKAAVHHDGDPADPDAPRLPVQAQETRVLRELLDRFLPDANGPLLAAETCLYTNTPDRHFLLGAHPAHPQVIVASACSGHGFKFASVVGEIVADLALDGGTAHDITPFGFARFVGGGAR